MNQLGVKRALSAAVIAALSLSLGACGSEADDGSASPDDAEVLGASTSVTTSTLPTTVVFVPSEEDQEVATTTKPQPSPGEQSDALKRLWAEFPEPAREGVCDVVDTAGKAKAVQQFTEQTGTEHFDLNIVELFVAASCS